MIHYIVRCTAAVILALAPVFSQGTTTLYGPTVYFGQSVALADLDGDGVSDIAATNWLGQPTVHSGADQSLLLTLTYASSEAIDFVGDVNGDGTPDLVVGRVGGARVFSGADGTAIYTLTPTAGSTRFGHAVAGLGDLNGDGVSEIGVGAPGTASGAGRALVYSGQSGALLFTMDGNPTVNLTARERMGSALAGIEDLDGDGVPEVIVGGGRNDANLASYRGRVVVLSGATSAVLYDYLPSPSEHGVGASVGPAGDVDGDGVPDFFFVGKRFLRVVSGASGSDIHVVTGGPLGLGDVGTFAGAVGDIDLDGKTDFSVMVNHEGIATISGADGSLIRMIPELVNIAIDIDGGHDFDGDGHADVVVGVAPGFAPSYSVGAIRIYSGAFLPAGIFPGTDDGMTLRLEVDGQIADTSVVPVLENTTLAATVQVPPALQSSRLLVAVQAFGTSGGMPVMSGFPIYFDPQSASPIVFAYDTASGPFATPFIPATGITVSLGVVPAGLAGTSLSLQAFSLAGGLAQNGMYGATEALEIRGL